MAGQAKGQVRLRCDIIRTCLNDREGVSLSVLAMEVARLLQVKSDLALLRDELAAQLDIVGAAILLKRTVLGRHGKELAVWQLCLQLGTAATRCWLKTCVLHGKAASLAPQNKGIVSMERQPWQAQGCVEWQW